MFSKIVVFLVGTYVGVYVDQNYQMPKVNPQKLLEDLKEFADNYKKK